MSIKAISINIVVYVVISTISTLLVCNYTNDINLLDIFSLLGTIGTFHGLMITFWQLKSMKTANEKASRDVAEKLEEINSLFSLSDISRSQEIISAIYSYLNSSEYLAAALKIDEIRKILQEAMAVKLLQKSDEIIRVNLKNLSVDMQSLFNEKREQGKLNVNVIIKHIDEVAMIMQNTSSNIKAKKYGVKV